MREYKPTGHYFKNPDGTFLPIMEPLISDADHILQQLCIPCNGGMSHVNARKVGTCRVECSDCGSWFQSEGIIDPDNIRKHQSEFYSRSAHGRWGGEEK